MLEGTPDFRSVLAFLLGRIREEVHVTIGILDGGQATLLSQVAGTLAAGADLEEHDGTPGPVSFLFDEHDCRFFLDPHRVTRAWPTRPASTSRWTTS